MSPLGVAIRRHARGLRRRWRPSGFALVHSPASGAAPPGGLHDPLRAARILAFLERERLLDRRRLHLSPEAPLADLRRVHTLDYLESLERPGATERVFGERLPDELERRLVAAQRTMVGGTTLAARLALAGGGGGIGGMGGMGAIHLGGGLHHARADRGAGFCLLHDVAVAVAALRAGGFAGRVLVVDLDLHDGDGTRALFAADPTIHTCSIHNRGWEESAAVEDTAIALGTEVGDETYLAAVRDTLPPLLDRFAPALVFYLAGADPAHDDALGDWRISDRGMLARDRFVLGELARRRLPVTVLLAGGYGHHAWRHSARSFSALLGGGDAIEPPTTSEHVVASFRQIAGTLPPTELAGAGGELLTADDLAEIFDAPGGRSRRFLGYYTAAGIELALERIGYLDELRALGFEAPRVELDAGGAPGDTVRIFAGPGSEELLLELRARRDRRALPGFELVWIEWLLLQNPRARFSAERPALPGQDRPGLGLLRETMAATVLVCDRLQLDGIGVTASHFHPAAQSVGAMRFLDPSDAPLFRALLEAVGHLPLAEACRAVESEGLVDESTGEPFRWRPLSMVYAVSDRLRSWFDRPEYRTLAEGPGPTLRILEPVRPAAPGDPGQGAGDSSAR